MSRLHRGFTFLELLIVIAVVAVVFTGLLTLINPLAHLDRARDTSRKRNLDVVRKGLEDYFNDKGCYPPPTTICYDSPAANFSCHICTSEPGSPTTVSSYLGEQICDPKKGTYQYLYFYGPNETCPQYYAAFAKLDSEYNPLDDPMGCKEGGCGLSPDYGFDYMVSSSNLPMDQVRNSSYFCYTVRASGREYCLNCGTYEACQTFPGGCLDIYPSRTTCRSEHPAAL